MDSTNESVCESLPVLVGASSSSTERDDPGPANPIIVKFGHGESAPVCLQLNSNGTGFVRWAKKSSIACSLQDGKLFAAHKSGAIAGNFSV